MNKCILSGIAIAMAIGSSYAASTYYVVPAGTPGVTPTPPYASWETAATDIQDAVDLAGAENAGNVVRVKSGTYPVSSQIEICKFPITLVSDDGSGKPDRNGTILLGGGPGSGNRLLYVFNQGGSVAPTIVDGFTFKNGSCDYGGGVYLRSRGRDENISRLQNCLITENTATKGGGGLSIDYGLVTNCIIRGNSVRSTDGGVVYGGGVYLAAGAEGRAYRDPTFIDTVISGNTVVNENGEARGGGMGAANCNYYAYGCRVEGNRAIGKIPEGGAAYSYWIHCFNDSVLADNACLANDGVTPAGQMGVLWGKLFATNCVFSGNVARQHAIAAQANVLARCKIIGNISTVGDVLWAGLMSDCSLEGNKSAKVVVQATVATNCLFSANTATNGVIQVNQNGLLVDSVFTNNVIMTKSDGFACVKLKEKTLAAGTTFVDNRGLLLFGSSSIVSNCMFTKNRCGNYGAVRRADTLVDCEISGNLQATGGGAMVSVPSIVRCNVISNRITSMNCGVVSSPSIRDSSIICNATTNYYTVISAGMEGTVVSNNAIGRVQNSDGCVNVPLDKSRPAIYRNCLIANNSSRGICSYSSEEILIESCTITGNRMEGVRYQENGGVANKVFRNCIISGNNGGYAQFHHYYGAAPMTFENCLTKERVDDTRYRYVDCILDKEPGFVDPEKGDYRLAPRSPCIDKGINEPWMVGASDLLGFIRIHNRKVDIGCFELKNPFLPTFFFLR